MLIGSSNTSSSTSTSTAGPTGATALDPTDSPTSKGKSSNTGPIVGGVVGGIAVIAAAVLGIFYLRRRRTRPAYAAPSEGAPSTFDGEPLAPPQKGYGMGQSDDGAHTSSLLPASPMSMRVYVRAFVPWLRSVRASCKFFYPPRTRTTQRHFQTSRQRPIPRTTLPLQFMDRNKAQETCRPPRRSRGHKDIMAYLLSDYALLNLTLDSWWCSRMHNRQSFLFN